MVVGYSGGYLKGESGGVRAVPFPLTNSSALRSARPANCPADRRNLHGCPKPPAALTHSRACRAPAHVYLAAGSGPMLVSQLSSLQGHQSDAGRHGAHPKGEGLNNLGPERCPKPCHDTLPLIGCPFRLPVRVLSWPLVRSALAHTPPAWRERHGV